MLFSFRSVLIGLTVLLVAALFVVSEVKHKRHKKRLTAEISSLTVTLEATRDTLDYYKYREQTVALAYAQSLLKAQVKIDSVRRLPNTKTLPAQIIRVEQLAKIRPRLPLPGYVSLPPSINVTMQVCYDSTQHTSLLADLEELDYRRGRDSLDREAYTRLQQSFNELYGGASDIAEPGLLKARGRKLRKLLKRINP